MFYVSNTALCTQPTRSQLLSSPFNTIAKIGQRVELECSTSALLPLRWDFAEVNSTRFEAVYRLETITRKCSSRYKVNTTTKGRFALVIDSVDIAHAGTYRCQNEPNYDSLERNASAQLAVIGSLHCIIGVNPGVGVSWPSDFGVGVAGESQEVEILLYPIIYMNFRWKHLKILRNVNLPKGLIFEISNHTKEAQPFEKKTQKKIIFLCKWLKNQKFWRIIWFFFILRYNLKKSR